MPGSPTFTIGTPTNGGSAVANGSNIDYTPNVPAGTPGPVTDTFTYSVAGSNTATVTVTINNTVPLAADGSASGSTQGVTPAGVTATFAAPGSGGSLGDAPATVAVTAQGTRGNATVSGNTITYTVTDGTFFEGSDTFGYTITDNDGEISSEGTVTVIIPNVQPDLSGSITTEQDTKTMPDSLGAFCAAALPQSITDDSAASQTTDQRRDMRPSGIR